jgi:septal ring factor EnvC (AmiA/AmiB activator)
MTRDEVLEEAAQALATEVAEDAMACLAEGPVLLRALKCKPPEKSPEVVLASNPYDTSTMGHADLTDLVFDLRRQMAELATVRSQRDALKTRLEATTAERDALRARLDTQEKLAEEMTARVKHIEWVQNGAKMPGES